MKGQNPHRAHRVAGVARVILMTVLTASLANAQAAKEAAAAAQKPPESGGAARSFTLEDCLSTALQNNRRRPASRFAVAAAEAQHRQALAAYWPQISARGGYQRMDESPNFLFPASSIQVPAQTLPLPPGYGLAIVDPANNVVGSLSGFPAQSIQVPAQDVKLMDPDSFMASLNAVWLLYDGGTPLPPDEKL